jgi:uncharacterized circularly permuted ATP-grasp superfamily protein
LIPERSANLDDVHFLIRTDDEFVKPHGLKIQSHLGDAVSAVEATHQRQIVVRTVLCAGLGVR